MENMKHWNVVVFGKFNSRGFMTGKAFANDAFRAVELSGEPTAIAFPSLEYESVSDRSESFEWSTELVCHREEVCWPMLRVVD